MNKGTIVKLVKGNNVIYRTLEVVEFYLERNWVITEEEETIEEVIPANEIKATARIQDENTIILTVENKEYKIKCNEFKELPLEKRFVHKIYKREKCIKSCYNPQYLLKQMKDRFWETTNYHLFTNLIAKLG